MTENMKGFCAAPWTEGVAYADGYLRTCCRNSTPFGNWKTDGLQNVWRSEAFQQFRGAIARGEFPDDACANCYRNGTARPLYSAIGAPFENYRQLVSEYLGGRVPEIDRIQELFGERAPNVQMAGILQAYFSTLVRLNHDGCPPPIKVAFSKLTAIGEIVRAFLDGSLVPPVVAPYRQVQLMASCNARCIHCAGLFSGEIVSGLSLEQEFIDEALSRPEDVIDFFMNGSEFLLYPGWKKIAARLARNGVKLSISTNGILLSPENTKYLIDNNVLQYLNVSVDGARKETIESIRVNVRYENLIQNIAFLLSYARAKRSECAMSFSFVLMRRNYREFPELVSLIGRLRDGDASRWSRLSPFRRSKPNSPDIKVYCQALENEDIPAYRKFVEKEHHSLVERDELIRTFGRVQRASKKTGIPVYAFYWQPLRQFIEDGCPFPPLPELKDVAGA
jgi:MoaA/NifB/PqqE/SkfB family radical SAM enzyme